MSEIYIYVLVFFSGLLLGIVFFGGLWLTVKKIVSSEMQALWSLASFFIRLTIVLAGIYLVSAGRWQRMLVCLSGLIVARWLVLRCLEPADGSRQEKEAGHGA
jgi:F1F0 ATPase subunit 2